MARHRPFHWVLRCNVSQPDRVAASQMPPKKAIATSIVYNLPYMSAMRQNLSGWRGAPFAGAIVATMLIMAFSMLTLMSAEQVEPKPRGLLAFAEMVAVMQHPRCMNCHRVSVPRIRDNARRHVPRVRSGNDGRGEGGVRCAICHKDTNNDRTRIPGAPDWRMPPYSMSWDGLHPADICDNLKDKAMNGGRDLRALQRHLKDDKLVQWAWRPGRGRSTPPVSRRQFFASFATWSDNGAPCPAPIG